jgi:hypothetical protein
MTSYKLIEKSRNKAEATFHIVNSVGDICGSVNVPPSEGDNLLRHWTGAKATPKQQSQTQNPFVEAMLKAKPRILNRQAILRGCC